MADLARLAGVSASTVSRALAGSPLVGREKREQILRIAQEHGYVVNSTARNLRLKRTQAISVVIPLGHEAEQPLTDPFFVTMLGHLADEVTQRGYGMFLQKILPASPGWLREFIDSGRSDGVIVIGQSTEHAALEEAAKRYAPLVVWGGRLARQSYCTVGTDNVAGGQLATEHLLSTGRRRILFLGDTVAPEIVLRHAGYAQALRAGPKGTAAPQVVPAHLTADAAYDAMRRLLARGAGFDGVFAASDVIAMSALRALHEAGRDVPGDVAVVGFDDMALAAHASPPLTSVRQDVARGARLLVAKLFARLAGEDAASEFLVPELVVRESSGVSPAAAARPAPAVARRRGPAAS
jgi:DNA-binding LacI/PurR family transcriptional regulator